MPSIKFLNDVVGIGGPDEGFGFAIVFAEVAVCEEGFDGIGPRAGGGVK